MLSYISDLGVDRVQRHACCKACVTHIDRHKETDIFVASAAYADV
jgi:hypothetical protein